MAKKKNYVQVWVDPHTKNRVWRLKATMPNKTIKQILDDALKDAEEKFNKKKHSTPFMPKM